VIYLDPKFETVESLACGCKGRLFLTILGEGLVHPTRQTANGNQFLAPVVKKGFLRVSRKWMIRLGGKFENVLVSQVKVLHHWRLAQVIFDAESYDLWLDPG